MTIRRRIRTTRSARRGACATVQRTSDEDGGALVSGRVRTPAQTDTLRRAISAKVLREEIVGHEKMLEVDPANVALHNGVALLYTEAGDLAGASRHFVETLRLTPTSAAAHYNVGMFSLVAGEQRTDAADLFTKALALDPEYANAPRRIRSGARGAKGKLTKRSATTSVPSRSIRATPRHRRISVPRCMDADAWPKRARTIARRSRIDPTKASVQTAVARNRERDQPRRARSMNG
jgi:tetratricopeptide (TPR) repeat protein